MASLAVSFEDSCVAAETSTLGALEADHWHRMSYRPSMSIDHSVKRNDHLLDNATGLDGVLLVFSCVRTMSTSCSKVKELLLRCISKSPW